MTYIHKYELRVDVEDFDGGKAYAKYSFFSVDPESSNYRLHISGYISGGAGEQNYQQILALSFLLHFLTSTVTPIEN